MVKKLYVILILITLYIRAYSNEVYPVVSSNEALKKEEITTALAFLGLHFKRFTYEVPKKHWLEFTCEQFKKGKKLDKKRVSLFFPKGENNFLILLHTERSRIKIGFFTPGEGGGSVSYEFKDKYSTFSYNVLKDRKLVPGRRIPLFAWAANKESIEGIGEGQTVEEVKSRYDLVMVVFVKLMFKK